MPSSKFVIKVLPREKGQRHAQLLVDDSVYEMTPAYLAGAQAMRDNVPWSCNPHRAGSQRHEDWSLGHEHESGGFHIDLRPGVEVTVPAT